MEHNMFQDPASQQVIKITHPGGFGRIPKIENGFISMLPAPPLFYLDRLALSNELFADDWSVLGVILDQGLLRFVTSQSLVVGERPEQSEVDAHMTALGFMRVGSECAYVHRNDPVAVFDTHLGNFLRGESGQIFAIDVIPGHCSLKTWEELTRMAKK